MSRRTGWPFTLPPVAIVSIAYEGMTPVQVELITDAEKFFWEGKLKKSAPDLVRAELLGFISIQRERKRLGLPYLTFDESDAVRMPVL